MRKISADRIFVGDGTVLKDKVILLDEKNRVVDIQNINDFDHTEIEFHRGTITPGFINTHCHLELSHMKGKVPTGTGLIPFIESVLKFRDFPQEVIDQAIIDADTEMQKNGIVAVGDICNKKDTSKVKSESPIAYYSFVEMFDFLNPAMTDHFASQYEEVYQMQADNGNNKKSRVPHAPYSVSKELFNYINSKNTDDLVVSLHNQECQAETDLFRSKSGELLNFYSLLDLSLDQFSATKTSSLEYALKHMNNKRKTILVHNTLSGSADINFAQNWNAGVYWATCANANLYIENKLPNYQAFQNEGARMTIGTDSLTSNWSLSVLDEIKSILKYCSYLSLSEVLVWACKNGAEALDFHKDLGTIEKNKKPGLNLLNTIINEEETNIQNLHVTKLA